MYEIYLSNLFEIRSFYSEEISNGEQAKMMNQGCMG